MIPGSQLHRLARGLFGARLSDRVFEPLLADLQREWRETPPGIRRALALARGYAAFWQSVVFSGLRAVAAEAVRPPRREIQASALATLTLTTTALILIQLAAVGFDPAGAVGQRPVVLWWIVFNTVTTTMPLALLPMCLRARVKQAGVADAVKIAIAGAVLTIVMNFGIAPWAQRHHLDAVLAHQTQVDAATRARSHQDRYAWAVVPRPDSVPQGSLAAIAGRAVMALAVAWMGWSIGQRRRQHGAAVAGCWVIVFLLLNLHQESEPAFQIWQRAMMVVILTVACRQAQRNVAAT